MRRVYGIFRLPIARLHGIFPRQDRSFREFRGFPNIELGIFRVAKFSGGGRNLVESQEESVFAPSFQRGYH